MALEYGIAYYDTLMQEEQTRLTAHHTEWRPGPCSRSDTSRLRGGRREDVGRHSRTSLARSTNRRHHCLRRWEQKSEPPEGDPRTCGSP